MDCSPPGSSVQGMSQARTLERVSISTHRRGLAPCPQCQGVLAGCCHSQSLGSLHLEKPRHALTPDPCRQLLTMCVFMCLCVCVCVCVCVYTHACSTSTPARSSFLRPSVTLRGRLASDSAHSWLGACPNGPHEWNNTSLSTYRPDVSRYCHVCG